MQHNPIDEIATRYKITHASAIICVAVMSDFGGRYDENTAHRIMQPELEAPKEDTDEFYRWLHDEVEV